MSVDETQNDIQIPWQEDPKPQGDLISRQAAINALCRYAKTVDETNTLGMMLEKIMSVQPSVQPQRWISVKERLPEPEEEVLWSCHFPGESEFFPESWFLRISSWSGIKNHGKPDVYGISDAVEIMAWMPLPEAYKGGQE